MLPSSEAQWVRAFTCLRRHWDMRCIFDNFTFDINELSWGGGGPLTPTPSPNPCAQ